MTAASAAGLPAADSTGGASEAGGAAGNPLGETPDLGFGEISLAETIVGVLKAVLNFMALVATVLVVIAGIRLVVSGGDEGEKDKAKKTIVYVVIGLVVIVLARAFVQFVALALGVET